MPAIIAAGTRLTVAQMGLAVIVVYKSIVTLIKVSILLIYLRLSVNKTFERLCRGSIYLLLTYQFIVIIVVPAQCTPLRKAWDFTGQVPGHCINTTIFYYSMWPLHYCWALLTFLVTSAFHIAMDIWILLLPYKLIISIPRPLRERLAVYAVFGLGLFSTICAVARFNYLVIVTHSKDPFYDSLPINTWSVIEVNVGILCASLPTLRPLFSQAQRDRTREALHLTRKKSTRSSKRGGMLNAKEMFITITALSFRSGKTSTYDDEEFDLHEERPPPVPPKDEKSAANVSYPDMAYRKL